MVTTSKPRVTIVPGYGADERTMTIVVARKSESGQAVLVNFTKTESGKTVRKSEWLPLSQVALREVGTFKGAMHYRVSVPGWLLQAKQLHGFSPVLP